MHHSGAASAAPRLRLSLFAGIALAAILAIALWPSYESYRAHIATATPAPLNRDYELRDRLVAFYEAQVRRAPQDQILERMLAAQYLQRFREHYDLGDVQRARVLAEQSLRLQPHGNAQAEMTLASAELAYHEFAAALGHERAAISMQPWNGAARAQSASLLMELGKYAQARSSLDAIPRSTRANPAVDAVEARYDELTGDLPRARSLIDGCIRQIDGNAEASAYDRSWYHYRAGQLAAEAGDDRAARDQYDIALDDFPNNATALAARAKLALHDRRWSDALADARRSAELYPLPLTLGYVVDAQRALGDERAARETDALIVAEDRLFAAQGVNDRLLALYYADHHEHLDRALDAARADLRRRGDEIYADDTAAWVYAARGDWRHAAEYERRALRMHSHDPDLLRHAAIIAQHSGP